MTNLNGGAVVELPNMYSQTHDVRIDGNKLKARRIVLRLSQVQLAALAGLPQNAVSRLEAEKVRGRERETQERLAKALKTTADTICRDEDAEPSEAPLLQTVPQLPPAVNQALLAVFDKGRHTFEDVDAVRAILGESEMATDAVDAAGLLLDAAASLRERSVAPTAARVAVEVARLGRPKLARQIKSSQDVVENPPARGSKKGRAA